MTSDLQASVEHGVGAALPVQRLLLLQLDGVFGVKAEEVDQLCSSIDLCLDHRLPLKHTHTHSGEASCREGGAGPAGRSSTCPIMVLARISALLGPLMTSAALNRTWARSWTGFRSHSLRAATEARIALLMSS